MSSQLRVQKEVIIRMETVGTERYLHLGDLIKLINLFEGMSGSLSGTQELTSLVETLLQGEAVDEI